MIPPGVIIITIWNSALCVLYTKMTEPRISKIFKSLIAAPFSSCSNKKLLKKS